MPKRRFKVNTKLEMPQLVPIQLVCGTNTDIYLSKRGSASCRALSTVLLAQKQAWPPGPG